MLSIQSIYQILKNSKKSTDIAIVITIILWLITIVDKVILKGLINFYIHTPVTYVLIFFLHFSVIKDEWQILRGLWNYLKNNIRKKDLYFISLVIVLCAILVLSKNKLNEYILNQNIFSLNYFLMQAVMNIKFIAKSILLYTGSIGTAILAVYLLNKPIAKKTGLAQKNDYFIPIAIILIGIFIAIKLYFILKYTGNYQDDWYHIVAGLDFFKTGEFITLNQYFDGTGYQRGTYMTILSNFFMLIFGKSVDVAQLAPAFIGLICFLILLYLAKLALKKNLYVVLFAILYMTNPFVIFNHLFIRFYVFYELFFLVIILLLIAFRHSLILKEKRRILIITPALILLNFLIWKYTDDKSGIIFPMYTILGSIFCILDVTYVKKSLEKKLSLVSKNKIFLLAISSIVLIAVIIVFRVFFVQIFKEIFQSSTNDGSNRNSLIRTICYTFAPLVFFTFLNFTQIQKRSVEVRILSLVVFSGLLIHIAMPDTYQVIRGFAYLWGGIYLSSIVLIQDLIEDIKTHFSKKFIPFSLLIILSVLILLTNKGGFSNSFFTSGPNIQGEVAYYEFNNAFEYMRAELKNKKIIESSYNVIPDMFYNLPAKYVLNLDNTLDNHYFPAEIKQINSIEEVEIFAQSNDICITIRDSSYKNLIGSDFMTYLVNNYHIEKSFIGYRIWCER